MAEACVLITVYNGAPWIDEALDSALGQRDVDVEVLVVDDGSTDQTPEILARRRDRDPQRVRVVRIAQSGLSCARNVGFDHIAAEFTTCLDADDRMHPRRVRLECDALRAHPRAVLSFAARWNFEDGSAEGSFGFTPAAFGVDPQQLFTEFEDPLSAMLRAREYPGTDACTVRTAWARDHGRFNERYRSFVDGERWIRTLHSRSVVYVAAPLYQRRLHPRSMSASATDGAQVVFSVIDFARTQWDVYSAAQQAELTAFEQRSGTWIARRAGLAGKRQEGIRFLFAHRGRLMSRLWWRTLVFLAVPAGVHATWRRLRASRIASAAQTVPLHDVMIDDPALVWQGAARHPHPSENRS